MEKEKSPQQQLDYTLLFILFLVALVSAISIYSAQNSLVGALADVNFVQKQITWYVIGFIAIAGTMIIDFNRFKQISWFLYGFGMILLLGLELNIPASLVVENKGATSWYSLPGLGDFQPSELMKIFLILLLSQVVVGHNEKYDIRTIKEDLLLIGKILLVSAPPLMLVMRQPDLGTAMVLTVIIGSILLISGIRWRFIFLILLLVVLAGSLLVYIYLTYPDFFLTYILDEYQLDRFYGWLAPYDYPTQGYQLRQSLLAIGSAGMYGKSYLSEGVYIPEPHTDFIFSVISEDFGFIGGSVVISLFFLLIYRIIHTALESHDPYGSYLCTGVIGMITFQVFQNIGMTIGVLPITGIPLPFISYGGSALLTSMIAIGIVLNVRSRTRKYMFD